MGTPQSFIGHTPPPTLWKNRCGFRLHRRLSVTLIEYVPTLPPSGICVNSAKTPKSNVKTRHFSALRTNVCEQRTIDAKNITGITVFLGILIIEAITFSYYRQKYNFSAASHRSKIQYNKKVGTTLHFGHHSSIKKKYLTRNCIKSGTFSGFWI